MNLETMINEISAFLIRKNVNNKHINTISTVHLYSLYFKILNTVRPKKLLGFASDISFLLGTDKVEIKISDIANTIIINIPKENRETIHFSKVIKSKEFKQEKGDLKFILGQNTKGEMVVKDLCDMPHLLIAGQTGSGKSVFLNSLICGMLQNRNVDFIMVDTKKVELAVYENLNSLLFPLCTNGEQTISALSWVVNEMNKRYDKFEKYNVRNINEFNAIPKLKKMNRIVIVIDELADLMLQSSKQVETLICRIAQLSRASGIFLVIATQRPSCEILTGLIKANLPTKIAFSVSTKVNSRIILDRVGAEKLLGKGDMLYLSADSRELERLQGVYIETNEIAEIVEKANEKRKKATKKNDILLDTVIEYMKQKKDKNISSAEIEKIFNIKENDSSEILKKLENLGYVGEYNLFSPRKILI